MCIGIPMQVITSEAGHAWCDARGRRTRVNTALVAPVQAGDWLLVFLGDAREKIAAARAAEVLAVIALVESALEGPDADAGAAVGFALPSALNRHALERLTGSGA